MVDISPHPKSYVRTRSTSLSSFDSFEYNIETKFVATSFNLGDVWNGMSTRVANCSIKDGTSCINLQRDLLYHRT